VEAFIRADLSDAEWSDSGSIGRFCTVELQQLIKIELARGAAFDEGFKEANADPMHILKPPFADTGHFIDVTREGEMSALAGQAIKRDGYLEVPIAFKSVVGGNTYDLGTQTAIVQMEAGEWRIADMIYADGVSLVGLLRRPKFMQFPSR